VVRNYAPRGGKLGATGGVTHLRAWGTTVTLAVDRYQALEEAEAIVHDELEAMDRACSRFRPDSEIHHLYTGGVAVAVSPLLYQAVTVSLEVAERTGGAVDPTVGQAVEALGYDRDFAAVPSTGPALTEPPSAAPGWWTVECDPGRRTVRLPATVRLDLGATAKALVADRAAARIASVTGSGVLVSVGGDVAVAGSTPSDGWPVAIAVDSSGPVGAEPVVAVTGGGVASSSTLVRSWRRGNHRFHHIVDPATGTSASNHWHLVTVAAASCVDANAASTAAIVWACGAADRLQAMGLPARLVRHDGTVITVAGWPSDSDAGTHPWSQPVDTRR
jgi:thiamine biosynthesis lipoprotein